MVAFENWRWFNNPNILKYFSSALRWHSTQVLKSYHDNWFGNLIHMNIAQIKKVWRGQDGTTFWLLRLFPVWVFCSFSSTNLQSLICIICAPAMPVQFASSSSWNILKLPLHVLKMVWSPLPSPLLLTLNPPNSPLFKLFEPPNLQIRGSLQALGIISVPPPAPPWVFSSTERSRRRPEVK